MSILALVDLVLGLLQGALTGLGVNDKYRKVASEIQAANEAISRAKDEVVTNTELESLRTTPEW